MYICIYIYIHIYIYIYIAHIAHTAPCRDYETSPGGTGFLGSVHARLPRPDMFEHPLRLTKQMNCR